MPRKPKKPEIVRFHFDDPIYECRIFVCVGGDVDDWDARLDKMWGIERKVVNSLAGRCFLPSTCADSVTHAARCLSVSAFASSEAIGNPL